MNKLSIVPVSDIPSLDKIEDVSLDNLMETYKTCLQLRELCEQESGIGIAAVQTGIHQKLFLVNFCAANKKYGYFINCKYEPDGEDKMLHIEGCLSLKTKSGKLKTYEVQRYKKIIVNGFKISDETELVLEKVINYSVSGLYAAVFQHEIDHCCGILISDIGKEIDLY